MMIWHFILNAKKHFSRTGYTDFNVNAAYALTSEYSEQQAYVVLPTHLRGRRHTDLGILLTSEYSHPYKLIEHQLALCMYPEVRMTSLVEAIKQGVIEANEQRLIEFNIHIQVVDNTFTFLGLNLKENT